MRRVTLEEHYELPFVAQRLGEDRMRARGFRLGEGAPDLRRRLLDIGDGRIEDLDRTGIAMQVLSYGRPGAELAEGEEGISLATEINDHLACACARFPTRFAGFANLPMNTPDAAAAELERAVRTLGFKGAMINGTTNGAFLDHPRFEPVFAKAEALGVPLYLHPDFPPEAVWRAYYDGLPGDAGYALATGGWGWHSETALHVLRLVMAGVLDRHPRLQMIVGHMGEGLPAMLERSDRVLGRAAKHLARSVAETLRAQVWITTSGLLTEAPFLAAYSAFGVDRIMLSVDYPYTLNERAAPFLQNLSIPAHEVEKISHANADRLLGLDGDIALRG